MTRGVIRGRRTRLEPLRTWHLEALHAMASETGWPFEGRDLELDEFAYYIFTAGARQHAIVRHATGQTVGLAQVTEDLRSRTAMVAFALSEQVQQTIWPMEALGLYLDYLFEDCGFRKLYMEMTESARARWGGSRWPALEARYVDHTRTDGGFEDNLIYGLSRSEWDPQFIARVTGRERPSAPVALPVRGGT